MDQFILIAGHIVNASQIISVEFIAGTKPISGPDDKRVTDGLASLDERGRWVDEEGYPILQKADRAIVTTTALSREAFYENREYGSPVNLATSSTIVAYGPEACAVMHWFREHCANPMIGYSEFCGDTK